MSEFRDQFVVALDAYRSALVSPGEGDWKRYWDALDSAAENGVAALDVSRQFARAPEVERHHVSVDLVGRIAAQHRELRDASVDVIFDAIAQNAKDPQLLASAATALGETRSERGVSFLVACINGELGPLRIAGVISLGSCADNSASAMTRLIEATKDDDPVVRQWATFGIAVRSQTDTAELRDALGARLNDASEDVRLEAVRGLAKRKDKRALKPVEDALHQSEPAPQILRAAEYLGLDWHPPAI